MTRRNPRRLSIKRETLRRLADGDLGRVAGGLIARCTYERSGCYGQDNTFTCMTDDCTREPDSQVCVM